MNRVVKIKNIAVLNRKNIKKDSFPTIIKYLDTGSLTKNKIESFQLLNSEKDKIPSRAQRKVSINTILYSTVRPNQEHFGIIERDFKDIVASTGFTTIDILDTNVSPKFIYYLLTQNYITDYLHTIGMNAVSSYPSISPNDIGNLKFNIPDLFTQKSIVKTLSDLDTKIELNNKINQELEAMAKTFYDYWFVQFDFPDANGKPYKSSGGKMVYNEELKREIPDGWGSNTISEWIANDKSGDWGKEQVEGNYTKKVSCIRGADINGLNGKGEVKAPERYILEKNAHKILEVGDFIIEISGGSPTQSTGRMAFITEETLERFEHPLICSNFCKAVTLKEKHMLFNFVYEWNRIYDSGVLFGWEGKTSGIKNFLFESFVTNYKIVQPQKELMELFYEKAKPVHAQIQKNLQQNQKLAELRDWLLPMLMNGQVTVGKAYDKSDLELGMVAEEQESYNEEN